ncbi:MAG: AsmA family protein [Elusimicrobiota bacterium]|jgi:hypothetical protein
MKKVLLYVTAAVVLAGLVVGYLAYSRLGTLVKLAVETMGPKVTGAAVRLDSVSLSPFSGKGRFRGLFIGNPPGFKTESAFELKDVSVSLDVASLATDRVKVHEVVVDGPEITMEMVSGGSNLSRLQRNVESFVPAGAAAPESKPSEPAKQTRLEVGLFKVTNGKVHLSMGLLGGKSVTLPLPDIELRDIGKNQGGASVKETVAAMMGAVTKGAAKAAVGAGGLLKDGGEAGATAAAGASKFVKGIFGRKKK